jgi:hypothetical protein
MHSILLLLLVWPLPIVILIHFSVVSLLSKRRSVELTAGAASPVSQLKSRFCCCGVSRFVLRPRSQQHRGGCGPTINHDLRVLRKNDASRGGSTPSANLPSLNSSMRSAEISDNRTPVNRFSASRQRIRIACEYLGATPLPETRPPIPRKVAGQILAVKAIAEFHPQL